MAPRRVGQPKVRHGAHRHHERSERGEPYTSAHGVHERREEARVSAQVVPASNSNRVNSPRLIPSPAKPVTSVAQPALTVPRRSLDATNSAANPIRRTTVQRAASPNRSSDAPREARAFSDGWRSVPRADGSPTRTASRSSSAHRRSSPPGPDGDDADRARAVSAPFGPGPVHSTRYSREEMLPMSRFGPTRSSRHLDET